MKNKLLYCDLLVHYQNLFTKKQISYLMDYFFNDMSYSEIAKKNKISNMGVCDSIKRCKLMLLDYEKKLQLNNKSKKRTRLIKKINNQELKAEFEKLEVTNSAPR